MNEGPYRRRFNLDDWRKRFKDTLAERFVLRFHMTLILLLVVAGGFVTTRALHGLGVMSMALRYFAAVSVGYGVFFLLVRAWLAYITGAVQAEVPHVHPRDEDVAHAFAPEDDHIAAAPVAALGVALPDAGRSQGQHPPGKSQSALGLRDISVDFDSSGSSSSSSSSGSSGFSGLFDLDDGPTFVVLVIVITVVALAIFGAAIYFVWEAPVILGEAAVEIVLASALVRSSRRIDRPGWSGSVLRATWVPAAIVLVLATVGGRIAQGICPDALTLPEVIHQCMKGD